MRRDKFDYETEGQLTIADMYDPPEKLFAVSRIFARARKDMSLAEQKAFVYALTQFRFTEQTNTNNCVKLDKKVLAKIIGIKSDDPDHLSTNLYDEIKNLPAHSFIEINEKDIGLYSNGFIITAITRFKNVLRVRFNEEYLPFFTGLTTEYITMWSSDIFNMGSRRSVQFYEYLRQNTDSRVSVNQIGLGVKQLKEMFGIPKDGKGSYVRENDGFDRSNFEKYVIDPICEDLSKCRMIALVLQPDGKYYEKVKRGNRVYGYRFYWVYTSHPAVATATEVGEIQDRVDQNPEILKVAKDIVTGEKRVKNGKNKNSFNQISGRDYDWDSLERQLLRAQEQEIPGQRSIEDYPEFMPE